MITSTTRNYLVRRYFLAPFLRVATHAAAFIGLVFPRVGKSVSDPVFIVGCSRSGTTLFAEIFGTRPDICNVMDASQVWDLNYYDKAGDDHRDQNDANLWESSRVRTSFALRQLFCGGGRLVNKNNQNSLRLRFLKAIFPNAVIIHVIRDARPVVLSNVSRVEKDVYRRSFPFGRFPKPVAWRSYLDRPILEQFAHQWKDITEQVRRDGRDVFGPQQYFEVLFEDFCSNPNVVLERTDRFCGLAPIERPAQLLSTISADQTNAWSERMAEKDQKLIERIAGGQLTSLGYPVGDGA